MKTTNSPLKPRPVYYDDHYFRGAAALLSAHFLVAMGEPESTWELLKLRYYYPALGFNFLMALTLIEWVYRCTRYLDLQLRWEPNFRKRLALQMVWGVAVPLLLDCGFAAVYYQLYGEIDLFEAGHFVYNFPVITLMIILLNAYYLIHYLMKMKYRRAPVHISVLEPSDPPARDDAYPLVIIRKNKGCFQVNAMGEMALLKGTIEQNQQKLPAARYFQINRKCIVERSAIQKVRPWRSRLIKLELKNGIYEDVFVSQRNSSAFKVWMLTGNNNC